MNKWRKAAINLQCILRECGSILFSPPTSLYLFFMMCFGWIDVLLLFHFVCICSFCIWVVHRSFDSLFLYVHVISFYFVLRTSCFIELHVFHARCGVLWQAVVASILLFFFIRSVWTCVICWANLWSGAWLPWQPYLCVSSRPAHNLCFPLNLTRLIVNYRRSKGLVDFQNSFSSNFNSSSWLVTVAVLQRGSSFGIVV